MTVTESVVGLYDDGPSRLSPGRGGGVETEAASRFRSGPPPEPRHAIVVFLLHLLLVVVVVFFFFSPCNAIPSHRPACLHSARQPQPLPLPKSPTAPAPCFFDLGTRTGAGLDSQILGFRPSRRFHHPSAPRKPNESMRLLVVTVIGVMLGFFIGISFPAVSITKLHFPSSIVSYIEDKNSALTAQAILNHAWTAARNAKGNDTESSSDTAMKIYVPTNPRGAESLAPGIVVPESDFHPRRLWGNPDEDLPFKPKYLVTFTVGISQKENINRAVKKFSDNFAILLFHYDGRVSEWDEFEWSKRAIHVSVRRQAKWWYAKRFLHPDIVASYEYIFIWDEDLGVEHFNAEKYIKLVKKYQLEISQPGLEPDRGLTWQMTKRRGDHQVHKETEERPGWCTDPHLPPCAAFVEIMAPVFSRDAWRCVWHMIQPAHEKIGVVDSQWIVHQVVPSLGNQGQSEHGRAPWEGVRERCRKEWGIFQTRIAEAEKSYYEMMGVPPPNVTFVH
uniref:Uncharacterized protein n=1 Tax=Oryza nivara TaxID=4536 RepID=A0A0E0FZH9_ORYNI